MLKIFRKNQFLRSLLLLPFAAILNINLLLDSSTSIPNYNTVVDGWFLAFRTGYPVMHWLVFSMLLFTGAVLLNRLVIINRLSNEITLLPGLFFILITSAFPLFEALSSITVSLILLMLILSNLMYINARTGVTNKIFNIGVYLGLMATLFLPQVIYFVFVLISINTLTRLKQRVVFNLCNGTLLPIYMTGLFVAFIGGSMEEVSDVYGSQFGWSNLVLPRDINGYVTLALIGIFLLFVLFNHSSAISKKSIQSVRKINVITWSVFFALIVHLTSGVSSLHNLVLLTPALAYFTSDAVLRFKKESNGELVLVLLLILCIIMPLLSL